jgi:hypothetical protein
VLRNILKVDYWDVDEMANKIIGVLNSEELEKELATQGNAELARVTWASSANKMFDHYHLHTKELSYAR